MYVYIVHFICIDYFLLGVRYNAEKKKVGNYYSTPIYRFRMKCHLCDNYFEIETDPKVSKMHLCWPEFVFYILVTYIINPYALWDTTISSSRTDTKSSGKSINLFLSHILQNCDYNVVSGARRKNERWEPSATETVETTGQNTCIIKLFENGDIK